jgi:hypothetical protein
MKTVRTKENTAHVRKSTQFFFVIHIFFASRGRSDQYSGLLRHRLEVDILRKKEKLIFRHTHYNKLIFEIGNILISTNMTVDVIKQF